MKTKKTFLSFIVVAFLLANCYDENVKQKYANELLIEKSSLSSKTQSEKYSYVTKHLNILRDGFLTVSGDENFKAVLYPEIEKRFDDDFDVLVETLENKIPNLGKKLSNSPFVKNGSYDVSRNAFTEINDVQVINLYPQVFIPNYIQLKEQRLIGSNPVIVAFNGDETVNELEGLRLNDSGKIEKVIVNEDYILKNEVWVIGLCDRKIPYGKEKSKDESKKARTEIGTVDCLNLFPAEQPCAISPSNWTSVWSYKFSIDCLKESIFSGNADVSITTWTAFKNFINPNTGLHEDADWFGDSDYRFVLSVDNFYLNSCWGPYPGAPGHFTPNYASFPIVTGFSTPVVPNESGGVGDVLYYIIFEHDNWPAGLNFRTVTPFWDSTTPLTIQYRSGQTEYAYGVFSSYEKCLVCQGGTTACDSRWNGDCAEFSFYKK